MYSTVVFEHEFELRVKSKPNWIQFEKTANSTSLSSPSGAYSSTFLEFPQKQTQNRWHCAIMRRLQQSSSGPMMSKMGTKNKNTNRKDRPIVKNMNTPNLAKNWILHKSKKNEAPSEVTAPPSTVPPISVRAFFTRLLRSRFLDSMYALATCTT